MISLRIDPELERRVIEAAQAEGMDPSAYASRIVSEALHASAGSRLGGKQVRDLLDELAASGKSLPPFPEEAYSRESFYRDHD